MTLGAFYAVYSLVPRPIVRFHIPFLLDLPAALSDNKHMSAPADVPCRCLIAEPDPFIASLLLRFAEGSGLACVQAQASDDVMELARQLKPAVIIIDAELPGDRVGWEIMRALKLDEATCHIALISCSWLSEPEVRSLVGGLDGHLQKPDFPYNDFERILQTTGVLAVARKDTGRPHASRRSETSDPLSFDLPTQGKEL